jgi:hypothetical protein
VTQLERVDAVLEPVRYRRTITPDVAAYIGLRANDPLAALVFLLCERYDLDPALEHLEIITTKGGKRRIYITRDGYLDIAHRSGQLDGISTSNVEHGETGWRATATVWRRDMRHPFVYSAGCGDDEEKPDPEAMAIARAERRALKRAFRVIPAIEREIDAALAGEPVDLEPESLDARPDRVPSDWTPTPADQRDAHAAIGGLDTETRDRFLADWRIDRFSEPWPADAVADAISRAR